MLKSCIDSACTASLAVSPSTKIAEMTSSIGYAKASNTDENDQFGYSVSLSSDGNTLAVGAIGEGSNAIGIDRDQDNTAPNAGAVYVFSRSGTIWTQQAYLKARRPDADDWFGYSVSLSRDGNTLAVGAKMKTVMSRLSMGMKIIILQLMQVRCTSLVDQKPHGINKPM